MKIQLCYASTRADLHTDLIEDLSHILSYARGFNSKHKVSGVLYYANNCYFQCLEGEKGIIEALFDRIKKDARHTNIVHLSHCEITHIRFKKWSMKYVQKNSKIDQLFKALGYIHFSPEILNPNALDMLLNILVEENSSRMNKKIGLNYRGVNCYM